MFRTLLMLAVLGGWTIPNASAQDLGWPREYRSGGHQIVLHQPQVDEWKDHEVLTFRAVVAVKAPGQDKATLGVIEVIAHTLVNKMESTVLLTQPESKVTFPGVETDEAARLTSLIREALPNRQTIEVDLDRLLADVKASEIQQREIEVNLQPPPIFYSDKPAILVIFMGEPRFKPVEGMNLLFATNTNWEVFVETGSSRYYLLNGDAWLTTDDPQTGTWQPAQSLPGDLTKLPDDENWFEVKKRLHAKPPATGMTSFYEIRDDYLEVE